MKILYERTYKELEEIDRVRENKRFVKELPTDRAQNNRTDPYVYQYRTLDSFWSIIESDSFWATNARFSNDHEEQSLGMKKLKEVLSEDGDLTVALGDCYIICFCDEDDKLSQWRGYAPEGVSIGFDFNNVRPFYIKKRDDDKKNKDEYLKVYNSCYKVQYITEDISRNEFADKFDLNLSENENNHENIRNRASDIISYVKHSGFYEEAESRLVFSDRDVDLSDCIHYRQVGNLKVPYIIVKANGGNAFEKQKCMIRLNLEDALGKKAEKALPKYLSNAKLKSVKVLNCRNMVKGGMDDRVCFGCSLREAYIPGINGRNPKCRYSIEKGQSFHIRSNNEIYISNSEGQEEVYDKVMSFLQEQGEKFKDVKVWCEGHLPIRSITVGNLRNKEIVKESIRHYCNQHYWLRCVDVKASATPFRSSLI